jgi:hypothetical protein
MAKTTNLRGHRDTRNFQGQSCMNAGSNWADLELLDHILRHRTLSGAAAALGVDQTTVSRRLAALERRIGSALFDRIDGKLVATPPLSGCGRSRRRPRCRSPR